MARKETITIDMILDTAFAMTREEGFANVTARKVAAKAGCSTQPIFRVYKNMDELWRAVYDKAAVYFRNYCRSFPKREKSRFLISEWHIFPLPEKKAACLSCCLSRRDPIKRECMNC